MNSDEGTRRCIKGYLVFLRHNGSHRRHDETDGVRHLRGAGGIARQRKRKISDGRPQNGGLKGRCGDQSKGHSYQANQAT